MAVMLITANNVFAQAHFETIDGLRYLIDENAKAATMVANPDEKYSGDIVVPEKVTAKDEKEYAVVALGDECFKNCSLLTNVIIPSNVTYLGISCFMGCSSLTSIQLPSSLTSLKQSCFSGCSSLASIDIPSTVTSLGNSCFSGCSKLSEIKIPTIVTSIGNSCFSSCSSLTNIVIPSSIISLDNYCFYNCSSLTDITLPSSLAVLGEGCFYNCTSLANITLPSSVRTIGFWCFQGCYSLARIKIPSSVTELYGCFPECTNLVEIDIPSSVTEMGAGCFGGCTNLKTITIPSSVTYWRDSSRGYYGGSFSGCTKLESIYFKGKLPGNFVDAQIPTNCIVYVPKAYLQDCKNKLGSQHSFIYAWDSGEDKPTPSCEIPAISYNNGSLRFSCSTYGAEYHYAIEAPDATNDNYSQDGEVALSAVYKISAYATADGYQPSGKATATLYWINANLENVPSTNINQSKTRGIVATSDGGIVTLSGLDNGEIVKFFSPDGRLMGIEKAENGMVSYATYGKLTLAKVGKQTIKILSK